MADDAYYKEALMNQYKTFVLNQSLIIQNERQIVINQAFKTEKESIMESLLALGLLLVLFGVFSSWTAVDPDSALGLSLTTTITTGITTLIIAFIKIRHLFKLNNLDKITKSNINQIQNLLPMVGNNTNIGDNPLIP